MPKLFHQMTITREFSGSAILEYQCFGQGVQVLIDDPLRLPALHDICWIALNADLRKAAVSAAAQPIQQWLEALVGAPLALIEVELGTQHFEGELLVHQFRQDFSPELECQFAVQGSLIFQLCALPPALSRSELRSIQVGDYIRVQRFVLRSGRRIVFDVSFNAESAMLKAVQKPPSGDISTSAAISPSVAAADELEFIIESRPVSIPLRAFVRSPSTCHLPPLPPLEGGSIIVNHQNKFVGRARLISIAGVRGALITEWASLPND